MSGFSGGGSSSLIVGQLPGTATNDSASAGNVGEYIESIVITGSAVALTTATAKTVTSISLTAGDWDVDLVNYYQVGASTSLTALTAGISLTTNTQDFTAGRFVQFSSPAEVLGGNNIGLALPPYRLSLAAPTTVFMVSQATFTVSTVSAFGIIRARRRR